MDKNKNMVLQRKTSENGSFNAELEEYSVDGKEKKLMAPYTIKVAGITKEVPLNQNTEISIVAKKAGSK